MTENFVETFACADGATYEIKTRLGWFEAQRVDQAGESILIEMDGEMFSSIEDARRVITDRHDAGETPGVLKFELRLDHAQKNLERLKCRMVGLNIRQIMGIPAAHVAQLLHRIEAIEEAEKVAIREVLEGNPTTMRL